MSYIRLFPTFRLSRQICQDIHRPAMFRKHWKRMMDHHLGMMEKIYDIGDELQSKSGSHRQWKEFDAKPLWWKRYHHCQEDISTSPSRSFGKVVLGDDIKKFEMAVDLGEQYKPEEVKVSIKLVNEKELHVGATIERGSTESGNYHKQEFSNVVLLPHDADIEGLKSTLSEDGILKVEAPLMSSEKLNDASTIREIDIEKISEPPKKSDA